MTTLNNEGCSISSIGRVIGFSKTAVCKLIRRLGASARLDVPDESGQEYEMDELKTFVGNKKNESWIIYALNKSTRRVIAFAVGRRTKENIKCVTDVLLKLSPQAIFTDRLNIYPGLIPGKVHQIKRRAINYIERKNLHLRQQLRRLQRKTICFSRSERLLHSSAALFFHQTESGTWWFDESGQAP